MPRFLGGASKAGDKSAWLWLETKETNVNIATGAAECKSLAVDSGGLSWYPVRSLDGEVWGSANNDALRRQGYEMTLGSVELRPRQAADAEALWEQMEEHRAVLYRLPTGGGKTLTALAVAKRMKKPRRVLVLTTRKVLVRQWMKEARRMGLAVARADDLPSSEAAPYASCEWPEGVDVLVGTWQGAVNRTFRRLGDNLPKLLIIDEAHGSAMPDKAGKANLMAQMGRRQVEQGGRLLGLTATPIRAEADWGFDRIYAVLLLGADYAELQADGHLVPLRVVSSVQRKIKGAGKSRVDGDYTEGETMKANDAEALYGGPAAEIGRRVGGGSKVLVFCVGREHAAYLANMLALNTEIRAALTISEPGDFAVEEGVLVSDGAGEVDEAVEAFRRGDVDVLVSVDRLGEGFDVPDCDVALMLRPTKSILVWLQSCGRVARPAAGKAEGLIVDMTGNLLRHGQPDAPREWSLLSADRQRLEAAKTAELAEWERIVEGYERQRKKLLQRMGQMLGGGGGRSGKMTEEAREATNEMAFEFAVEEVLAEAEKRSAEIDELKRDLEEARKQGAGRCPDCEEWKLCPQCDPPAPARWRGDGDDDAPFVDESGAGEPPVGEPVGGRSADDIDRLLREAQVRTKAGNGYRATVLGQACAWGDTGWWACFGGDFDTSPEGGGKPYRYARSRSAGGARIALAEYMSEQLRKQIEAL